MTPEEAWGEVVKRGLYVMPPAAVGPREWYVTDDERTAHGFGVGPIQAIKAFLATDDLDFLE
jgi:hypothetical protein